MAQELTLKFFEPLAGKTFAVQPAGTLQLVSVTPGRPHPGYEIFSLIFHGPAASMLPQQVYTLQAEGLEPMEIFLVPIGQVGEEIQYQAVFNCLITK
jgi:hypothetical protein